MVAVVRTTNGQNPRAYATRLFNRWGIGNRLTNRGVLVFAAMNDRKAEIVLGDGIDSAKDEAIARKIMSQYMIPEFKRGQPSKGIRVAVEQCAKRFFPPGRFAPPVIDVPDVAKSETGDSNTNTEVESRGNDNVDALSLAPAAVNDGAQDLAASRVEAAGFVDAETTEDFGFDEPVEVEAEEPVGNVAFDHNRNANLNRPARERGPMGGRSMLALLLGGTATLGGTGLGYRMLTARNRPRNCEHCRSPMIRLDEVADDAHLDRAERLEERLGSVDYDVWSCTGCSHVVKVRYGAFFTRFGKCPRCDAKTKSSVSRTLSSATTMSTGLREVEESCEHCDYHNVQQHIIPRVTQSDSSGFSSGGGGGMSSGGGGMSSGGGASGSW